MMPGLFDPHRWPYRWEDHVPYPGRWRSDLAVTLVCLAALAALAPDERRAATGHLDAAGLSEEVAGGPEGTAGWMPLPLVRLGRASLPAQDGGEAGACGRA